MRAQALACGLCGNVLSTLRRSALHRNDFRRCRRNTLYVRIETSRQEDRRIARHVQDLLGPKEMFGGIGQPPESWKGCNYPSCLLSNTLAEASWPWLGMTLPASE